MAKIVLFQWLSNALMSLGTGLIVTGLVSLIALNVEPIVTGFSIGVGVTLMLSSLGFTVAVMILEASIKNGEGRDSIVSDTD